MDKPAQLVRSNKTKTVTVIKPNALLHGMARPNIPNLNLARSDVNVGSLLHYAYAHPYLILSCLSRHTAASATRLLLNGHVITLISSCPPLFIFLYSCNKRVSHPSCFQSSLQFRAVSRDASGASTKLGGSCSGPVPGHVSLYPEPFSKSFPEPFLPDVSVDRIPEGDSGFEETG
jgi:hypothetical protein